MPRRALNATLRRGDLGKERAQLQMFKTRAAKIQKFKTSAT